MTEELVPQEATVSESPSIAPPSLDVLSDSNLTPRGLLGLQRDVLQAQSTARSFKVALDGRYDATSTGDDLKCRGIALWMLGRFEHAGLALKDISGDALADFVKADMALREDHIRTCIGLLEGLIERQPDELIYRQMHADALERTAEGDAFEKAVAHYLEVDGDSAPAHYLRGLLAEHEGEYDEAEQRYATAVVMDPDCDAARFRLARHHYLRGEEDKAIELYEELSTKRPANISALMNLGVIYEDREDFKKAENCYRVVRAFYPGHTRALMYERDAIASQSMYYDEERERKEDKMAQILRIPVTDFELSVRSRNCLAKMNLKTLGDLVTKTEAELLAFKNFGETSLSEIKEILRSKGLRLGTVPDSASRRKDDREQNIDPDSVMNKPITDLDLSVRSRKACDGLGLRTVGDVTRISEAELLACKNFGQTSLIELKKKLQDLGLTFKG